MNFLIYEFLRIQKVNGPIGSNLASISSEIRRYTGKSVIATDFAAARSKAAELFPQIPVRNLRVVIA